MRRIGFAALLAVVCACGSPTTQMQGATGDMAQSTITPSGDMATGGDLAGAPYAVSDAPVPQLLVVTHDIANGATATPTSATAIGPLRSMPKAMQA